MRGGMIRIRCGSSTDNTARHRLIARYIVSIGLGALLASMGWDALHLRYNTTPSLPRGVYRLTHEPVHRGALALVCLPSPVAALAQTRRYLPAGSCATGVMPIGKIVQGIPGDTIVLSTTGTSINGRLVRCSAPRPTDTHHRPLPRPAWHTHVLGPHEVWLDTEHPQSFGARYFGTVPQSAIVATLRPVWVVQPSPSRCP